MLKITEIGLIPNDWECERLLSFGEILAGLTYTPKDIVKRGLLVLRSSNIKDNKLSLKDNVFVNFKLPDEKLIKKDDILICVRNGSRRLIGKSCIISKDVYATWGAFMSVFRGKNAKYINQYFQSLSMQKQIAKNIGATINQITTKDLKSFLIALPTNEKEILKIEKSLTDIDNYISWLECLVNKKKMIKQGVMQELLTGKKHLSGFNSEWIQNKVKKVCMSITTGKLDANAMTPNGIYRFYTCAKNYYFINNYAFDTEALLISGNGANVGYVHYYKGKFNAYQRTYVLSDFKIDVKLLKNILDFCLSERIKKEVNSGNTPYIKLDTIAEMKIFYPSDKNEQEEIANILTNMDEEIESLEQDLEKYKHIKQGMMEQLLTGKIRVV